MKKILDLDYKCGLRYILLDLNWISYGQRIIIKLITYFTGVGFENTWITNFHYNDYILQDLGFKILDYGFEFRLLSILLDLGLKVLGLQIWITISRYYWTWTLKYLDCDLGL